MNLDHIIVEFDRALKTLFVKKNEIINFDKNKDFSSRQMSSHDIKLSASLMRVNHSGEVCAQALYAGQRLMAEKTSIRELFAKAMEEEASHLNLTGRRLGELGARPSSFDPVFYSAAVFIGLLAGSFGDKWSLGFVYETEKQVEKHLDEYIARLPERDTRSRSILGKMKQDEMKHADNAIHAGGAPLPLPMKFFMATGARIMKKISYRI